MNLTVASARGSKSTHIHYLNRGTHTCVKKTLVKVLTQLPYSSESNEVQVLKCTQCLSKQYPSEDISTDHFCAKLSEPQAIII